MSTWLSCYILAAVNYEPRRMDNDESLYNSGSHPRTRPLQASVVGVYNFYRLPLPQVGKMSTQLYVTTYTTGDVQLQKYLLVGVVRVWNIPKEPNIVEVTFS